ncbi:MAG: radical SAM protein [Candidatus Helarchaeota archaeon]
MDKIRISIGTAAILDLISIKLDTIPTTAYLMTYLSRKCYANCAFCPQSRESKTNMDYLSRIQWPDFSLSEVLKRFSNEKAKNTFKRICIQALNYPDLFQDLIFLVKELKKSNNLPISLSIPPLRKKQLIELYKIGIRRVGIALDVATPELFFKIKGKGIGGPYKWETHLKTIKEALEIFGPYNVTSHLIIGMGETELEAVSFIQSLFNLKVHTGLFAFTPIKGTILQNKTQPSISSYRRIQLARYIIINEKGNIDDFKFDNHGKLIDFGLNSNEILEIIQSGLPFLTSGCPGCNRPYYNERPGKNLYNFPRMVSQDEIEEIKMQLQSVLKREKVNGTVENY